MKKLAALVVLSLLPLGGCSPYGYPHGSYAYYDWDWNQGYDGYGPRHYYAPPAAESVQPSPADAQPSTNWWFCGYYYYPYPPYAGYYPYYGYQQPDAAAPTYTSPPPPPAFIQPSAPQAPRAHAAPLPPPPGNAHPLAPPAPSNYAPPPGSPAAAGPPAALTRPPDYYSTYYGCCSR